MASITFNRPIDKIIADPEAGRLKLEWDNYFNLLSRYMSDILQQGSFTMPAAATYTISDVRVRSGSHISLEAINASAATLRGSAANLYVDVVSIVPRESFTVKTANGASAAGTERFSYAIIG